MLDQKSLYNEYGLLLSTRLEVVKIYFSNDLSYCFSLLQKTQCYFYSAGWWREGWEVGVQSSFPNIK